MKCEKAEGGGLNTLRSIFAETDGADAKFREKLQSDFDRVGAMSITNWPSWVDTVTFWHRKQHKPAKVANATERSGARPYNPTDKRSSAVEYYNPAENKPLFK